MVVTPKSYFVIDPQILIQPQVLKTQGIFHETLVESSMLSRFTPSPSEKQANEKPLV